MVSQLASCIPNPTTPCRPPPGWLKQGFKPIDVTALVAVLKRYAKQADIVARVAGIIGDVAHDYTEDGVRSAVDNDAVPALSDALRAHPQDGEVQFNALYALRWIACTGKEPERKSLESVATVADIETLIEAAVSLFSDDGGVVEEAEPLLDEVVKYKEYIAVQLRKAAEEAAAAALEDKGKKMKRAEDAMLDARRLEEQRRLDALLKEGEKNPEIMRQKLSEAWSKLEQMEKKFKVHITGQTFFLYYLILDVSPANGCASVFTRPLPCRCLTAIRHRPGHHQT